MSSTEASCGKFARRHASLTSWLSQVSGGVVKTIRLWLIYPLRAAGVAFPVAFSDWNGEPEQHQRVAPESIDHFEADIKGVALGTARLIVGAAEIIGDESSRNRFVQEGDRFFGILGS